MRRRLRARHTLIALVATGALGAGPAWAAPTAWALVPTQASDTLYAVSCTSTSFCAAVGTADDEIERAQFEMWNGNSWKRVGPRAAGSVIVSVTCSSDSFCMAVGIRTDQPQRTLIYEWHGAQWKRLHSPNHGHYDSQLYGVSCTSTTACTAVGFWYKAPRSRTLVESWNGAGWSIVSSPSRGPRDNQLHGVSRTSSTHCIAIGEASKNGASARPLIESYDGSDWTIASSPDIGGDGYFVSVSCGDVSSCVATGLRIEGSDDVSTLAATWDGTGWSTSATPNPGTQLGELSSVSCTSSTKCVAVGAYDEVPNRHIATLVEAWDGGNWSVTPSPSTSTSENYLYGVSCTSDESCAAVGFSIDGALVLSGSSP